MKSHLVRRLGVRVVVAALGAAPVGAVVAASAQADTSAAGTSSCTDPALSQPFLPWGDSNWYALAPGEAPDDFAGTGWTLTGGAQIVTTALQDGRTGSVLNLPVGAKAVSPTICLTSACPTADDDPECIGQQRRQRGFSVSYAGTNTANAPLQTGTFKTTGNQGVAGRGRCHSPRTSIRVRPRAGS